MTTRREHDLLGDRDVPAEAYYGVHTLRAVENFPITATPISIYPDLIVALASIKLAAAQSNRDLNLLDATRANAIIAAAEEIKAGRLLEQFVVDVIQGGAGTSTNMNANEVIANRALELLGRQRGDYKFLHPNEHVNMSQSTNDVYPTALKIATYHSIFHLVDAMAILRSLGYRILEAQDGEEGLSVFDANAADIDMLLTDVVLPGKVRGRELAEHIKARRPEVKVLFMSGYTENSIVHHGRLDDGVHLLGKPFKREQLARKVADVLGPNVEATADPGNVVNLRGRQRE